MHACVCILFPPPKSAHGISPLENSNTYSSLRASSRLAYGQLKPSIVGSTPNRSSYYAAVVFPLRVSYSRLRRWDFSHSKANVNSTPLLRYSLPEAKSLQVSLMGLSLLGNNVAGSLNHTYVKPTISEIEFNTPKRHDHIDSKKPMVKQARQNSYNHFHSKEIYMCFIPKNPSILSTFLYIHT